RVEKALARVGAEVYQSGSSLVRPVMVEVDAAKGRKTKIAVLVPIHGPFLKSELTRSIDFFKWKQDEKREGIAPPQDVVNAILSRFGKWKFPMVTGVITTPTLRRDGTVLAKEGYDPATGLMVLGPLPEMPKLKADRASAERAIDLLDGL